MLVMSQHGLPGVGAEAGVLRWLARCAMARVANARTARMTRFLHNNCILTLLISTGERNIVQIGHMPLGLFLLLFGLELLRGRAGLGRRITGRTSGNILLEPALRGRRWRSRRHAGIAHRLCRVAASGCTCIPCPRILKARRY